MKDPVERQAVFDAITGILIMTSVENADAMKQLQNLILDRIAHVPTAQPEDYTDLKREFIRMASYIDVLLECSDVQKETLLGFISRLAEFMPWTERD